jgi:organic radical activating enzyme
MKTYKIAEIVGPTIQGEGLHLGRPCLILRLAGCNAWNGSESSRHTSACPYCDTDFRCKETLTLETILERHANLTKNTTGLGCLLTGGEPLLQADEALLTALGKIFPWTDLETNGTIPCPVRPANVFLSCSPKAIPSTAIVVTPDCWKVLIPDQASFLDRAMASGKPVFVQPVMPPEGPSSMIFQENLQKTLELCYLHGISLGPQLHRFLGVI